LRLWYSLTFIYFRRHVEQEYTSLNKKFVAKDDEYCQAASGLEKELNSLRHQLQVVKKEKDRAVKDKDHLLDEVSVGL
jgi:septation ring formation regulator EzrA